MLTLIVLFTAAAGAQLVSWILIGVASVRTLRARDVVDEEPSLSLSVIVAVRDGAAYLPGLLRALRQQTVAGDEVLVVNDHSKDETGDLVRSAAAKHPQIRLVHNDRTGKKAALAAGVAAASNETLAFTDADCIPGPKWLSEIRRIHAEGGDCVAVGYGPYNARKGVLNALVRYETLHTALLSITAVAFGKPYMGVGRNLSYSKETFRRVGGFERSADLLSGDDDLFVQTAAALGIPVRFMAHPAAFVHSEAPHSVHAWLKQKRRHLSAGRRYGLTPKIGLFVYHASALLCWLAPFALGWIGVLCLLCRLAPGQLVIASADTSLTEGRIAPGFVLLDLAYQAYLIAVAPIAWFRPPTRW